MSYETLVVHRHALPSADTAASCDPAFDLPERPQSQLESAKQLYQKSYSGLRSHGPLNVDHGVSHAERSSTSDLRLTRSFPTSPQSPSGDSRHTVKHISTDHGTSDSSNIRNVADSGAQRPAVSPATSSSTVSSEYSDPKRVPGTSQNIYPCAPISPEFSKRYPQLVDFFKKAVDNDKELKYYTSMINYELRICGSNPSDAVASIVIFCTEAIFKPLRALINSKHIRRQYQIEHPSRLDIFSLAKPRPLPIVSLVPFKVVFWREASTPTRRLSATEQVEAQTPSWLSLCGSLVRYGNCTSTLGLLVSLDSKLYGLTVDHLFQDNEQQALPMEEFDVSRFEDDCESEDAEDELWVDDVSYEDIKYEEISDRDFSILESSETGTKEHLSLIGDRGIVIRGHKVDADSATETANPYLDWALIQFDDGYFERPNAFCLDNDFEHPKFLASISDPPHSEETPVYMISAATGVRSGIMTSNTSYIGGRPGSNLCQVRNVTLSNSAHVVNGDCGSLIVDQSTLQVFGHVIASNPLGEAYVVPLRAVFQQIEDALGVSSLMLPDPNALLEKLVEHYAKIGEAKIAGDLDLIRISQTINAHSRLLSPENLAPTAVSELQQQKLSVHHNLPASVQSISEMSSTTKPREDKKELGKDDRPQVIITTTHPGNEPGEGVDLASNDLFSQVHEQSKPAKTPIVLSTPRSSIDGGSLGKTKAVQAESRSSGKAPASGNRPSESVQDSKHHDRSTRIGPSSRGFEAPDATGSDQWAKDLSKEFENLLRTKKLSEHRDGRTTSVQAQSQPPPLPLSPQEISSQASSSKPPPYKPRSLAPSPPTDPKSERFRKLMLSISLYPMKYENPGLLDEALAKVDLDLIYSQAEDESSVLQAIAESHGDGRQPEWGYEDCVIRALLRWFRRVFFEFVNKPMCRTCHSPTVGMGTAQPTPDEAAIGGAAIVELYQCSNTECGEYERFPRYSNVWHLMETRRGRCGEWATTFAMLCRAVGSRVRFIWNSEDQVWVEVYSRAQRRWVHVDPCEESWDNPTLYTRGWGVKIAYVIAYSSEGATDVTRRYVRHKKYAKPRENCPEEVLLYIINEIRVLRRADMSKKQKFELEKEDAQEEKELLGYVVDSITQSLASQPDMTKASSSSSSSTPAATSATSKGNVDKSDSKTNVSTRDSKDWVKARGEHGPQEESLREGF